MRLAFAYVSGIFKIEISHGYVLLRLTAFSPSETLEAPVLLSSCGTSLTHYDLTDGI